MGRDLKKFNLRCLHHNALQIVNAVILIEVWHSAYLIQTSVEI